MHHLNRFGVPSRCLAIDLLTLRLIFLLGNLPAILAVGNLGYLLAHIFTLGAFVLLSCAGVETPTPLVGITTRIP